MVPILWHEGWLEWNTRNLPKKVFFMELVNVDSVIRNC